MSSPHDAIFKDTFSQPEHAAPVLRTLLPPALAEAIEWASLALQPGSFIGPELEDRHTDLLYAVSFRGRRALLYLLWEHQSTVQPLMPLRLLEYMVRIWNRALKDHPDARALPPIVPVVLHHSDDRGWTAPTRFEELFDVGPAELEALGSHVVRFQFILDDLGRTTDEELRGRAITALGKIVLGCLHHARDMASLVVDLDRWAAVLRDVYRAPNGATALRLVLRYMIEVGNIPPEDMQRVASAALPEAKEDIVTTAEQLIQRGVIKGQREALLRVMEARFGTLPEDVTTQVRAAEPEAIDRWLALVGVANSTAEVLGAAH